MRLAVVGGLEGLAAPEELERHGLQLSGDRPADIALGVGWRSLRRLAATPAGRHVLWVADLESGAPDPSACVALVLGARWLLPALRREDGGPGPWIVRPGLDRRLFVPVEPVPHLRGPLRVAGGGTAARAVAAMRESGELVAVPGGASTAARAAAYRTAHVVVAPWRPVEAFASGATVVTPETAATREEVGNGEDGLLATSSHRRTLAGHLDRLAADPRLLHLLRHGAGRSAAAWPSVQQQGILLAGVLRHIAAGPPAAPLRDVAGAVRRRDPASTLGAAWSRVARASRSAADRRGG
jgi:hypothetical protein